MAPRPTSSTGRVARAGWRGSPRIRPASAGRGCCGRRARVPGPGVSGASGGAMLRRLAKSAIAHTLGRTGADAWIGGLSGVRKEPLVLGYHRVLEDAAWGHAGGMPGLAVRRRTFESHLDFVGRRFRFV